MTNQANQILNAFAVASVSVVQERAAQEASGAEWVYTPRNDKVAAGLMADSMREIVAVKTGKSFRIEAIFKDGSSLVIKKTSSKMPTTVQLHSAAVNRFVEDGLPGSLFTFSKSSSFPKCNLKSYSVK